jgi:hypothetical protein
MLNFKASMVQWKDIRPWRPTLVSGNSKSIFLADEYEAAKLRWAGGAQRPVRRAKRRAAHGRAREAKTH